MNIRITLKASYFAQIFGLLLLILLLNSSCGSSDAQSDVARDFVKQEIVATNDTVVVIDEPSEKSSDKKEKKSNQNENEFSEFKKDIEKRIAMNESKVKNMMKKSKRKSSSFIEKLNLLDQENENLKIEVEEYQLTSASKLERFKLKMYDKVDHLSIELDQLNLQDKSTSDNSKVIPLQIDSAIKLK